MSIRRLCLPEGPRQFQRHAGPIATTVVARDLSPMMGAISGELPDIGMVDNPDMASYIQGASSRYRISSTNGPADQFFSGPLNSCTQTGEISLPTAATPLPFL